ncbi:IucA/IucC family protein [Bacillus sp. SCS-153A]|uniref:IucA/IucC family protein n=1 Tax=Rossellomorea sedimentorum TaxID=3115294 RepID=UPI0039068AD3
MKVNLNSKNVFSDGKNHFDPELMDSKMGCRLKDSYHGYIEKGRQHILQKLAASLLREDIENLYSDSVELKKIGSVYVTSLLKVYKEWEPFLHQLEALELKDHLTYRMKLFEGYILLFPIKNEFAFRRLTIEGDILQVKPNSFFRVETGSELLQLIGLERKSDSLMKELDNGTDNLTMAYKHHHEWAEQLVQEAGNLGAKNTLQYNRTKKLADPDWSSLLFYEQMSLEGHHLHPGTKTKTGMTAEDVCRYSPEFHGEFPISFVAVHRDYLQTRERTQGTIEALFDQQYIKFQQVMTQKRLDPACYQLLPVHEWQYRHSMDLIYKEEIARNIIIPLPSITAQGTATSSFRTVVPVEGKCQFIKLAVNSQMTSTVRSISKNTALNSTVFSELMDKILKKEPNLKQFIPLNETAGYAFESNDTGKSRNLTVVIRENRENDLEEDEIPIAGSSLYNESPLTNKTILGELLDEYVSFYNLSKREGAISFFKEYLSITLPGFLTLMTKYGVALEGHLQNSVPVFKNGRPVKFYFRDWGGARIYTKRLEAQGLKPDFLPGSLIQTSDRDEMYSKAHYTIIQSHLGEIIRQLVECSGLNESLFWREVKTAMEKVFHSLSSSANQNVEEDRSFFYKQKMRHKALTKMRMSDSDGYLYSSVTNPLAKKDD